MSSTKNTHYNSPPNKRIRVDHNTNGNVSVDHVILGAYHIK